MGSRLFGACARAKACGLTIQALPNGRGVYVLYMAPRYRLRSQSIAAQPGVCVATFLLEGDCFVDQFDEACVHDKRRIAPSERVEVHADPVITARGAKFPPLRARAGVSEGRPATRTQCRYAALMKK